MKHQFNIVEFENGLRTRYGETGRVPMTINRDARGVKPQFNSFVLNNLKEFGR